MFPRFGLSRARIHPWTPFHHLERHHEFLRCLIAEPDPDRDVRRFVSELDAVVELHGRLKLCRIGFQKIFRTEITVMPHRRQRHAAAAGKRRRRQ